MIIYGVYPDAIPLKDELPLCSLDSILSKIIPNSSILHLLPFYPSCGDGGFSIVNYQNVDDKFGSWRDIEVLANKWKLLVDGVFNHIGIENKLVLLLKDNPSIYKDLFYTNLNSNLVSPRGEKVDRLLQTREGLIEIRQTFSNSSVDINLESSKIIEIVNEWVYNLYSHGIWGIRLDSVAYYKKGEKIRHNNGSYMLAKKIVDLVRTNSLNVIAQIDANIDGIKYFTEENYQNIPIYDFGYSAILVLALFEHSAEQLSDYLNQSIKGRCLIRAPRTHDGILLRTSNLKQKQIDELLYYAKLNDLNIRENDGDLYEINSSMPFIFSKIISKKYRGIGINDIIEMVISLTSILNSIPYYYFNFIIGYIPEMNKSMLHVPKRFDLDDPRTMNRIPVYNWNEIESSMYISQRLPKLLQVIGQIHQKYGEALIYGEVLYRACDSILFVESANGIIKGIFNFAYELYEINQDLNHYKLVLSNNFHESIINSYGYAIFIKK